MGTDALIFAWVLGTKMRRASVVVSVTFYGLSLKICGSLVRTRTTSRAAEMLAIFEGHF